MKRTTDRKIGLKAETIRHLTTNELTRVQGGMAGSYTKCSLSNSCDNESCSTYIVTHCCPIV